MTSPAGPIFTGRFEEYVVDDDSGGQYTILFLPDRMNDELQAEGSPAYYYYIPEQVRLARKGDVGDYKFRHIHFVGTFDRDTNVGLESGEVQGGVLSFTTTSRYPTSVMMKAQEQLIAKWNGKTEAYWGLRSRATPQFAIAPIVNNQTIITNLSPNSDGTVPVERFRDEAGGRDGSPGGEAPRMNGEAPRMNGEAPRMNGLPRLRMRWLDETQPVRPGKTLRDLSSLDEWAWQMQGQGSGSITGGENAYSGLIGPLPSEIVWAGFHGAYSPIVVAQNLQLQMWSQKMRIKIRGNWDRIYEHFSAAANAQYLWFAADVKAEFNNLRYSGGIQVEIDIDGTVPSAQEMDQAIQSRIDTIVNQFMEQAKKVIFEPAPPAVKAAEAPNHPLASLFGGSAGFALNYRRDSTNLELNYEETRNFRYLQNHAISSSLEGFYNEIKNDPSAEQKYFTRLVLGDLGRKVPRIVKPVVNWPDRSQGWAGDPVAFLSAQVGYPDSHGGIQWQQEIFQPGDPVDKAWEPVFVMWRDGEVLNPPNGWQRDETFIRRKVHLLEPPGEDEFPFMRVDVERNEIELDPDPMASPSNDGILEVRADNAGVLNVGPMAISALLESAAQVVEVELRVLGDRADGTDRSTSSIRFRWNFDDQNSPRYLKIFTGQMDFVPSYEYRVHVTVKGTLFSKGMAWSGPWTPGAGNGPLMIQVPAPSDPGVDVRALTERELREEEVVRVEAREEEEEEVEAPVGGRRVEVREEEEEEVEAPVGGSSGVTYWSRDIELEITDEELIIRANLPDEFELDDLEISPDDNELTISDRRGRFRHSWAMHESVDEGSISARVHDDVLEVRVAHTEMTQEEAATEWISLIEARWTDEELIIRANLPDEFELDDLEISPDDNELTISDRRGRFRHSWAMHESVDEGSISARVHDDVLEVRVARAERDKEERTIDGYELESPTAGRRTRSTETGAEAGKTDLDEPRSTTTKEREEEPEGYVPS